MSLQLRDSRPDLDEDDLSTADERDGDDEEEKTLDDIIEAYAK